MIIMINEVSSYMEIPKWTLFKIKAAITENYVDINPKHKDAYSYQNINIFIFISKNAEPLFIEKDDRRFLVLELKNERCNDEIYFTNSAARFEKPRLHEYLLTYFRNQNLEGWKLEFHLPFTEAKQKIIDSCSGSILSFIEDI